MMIEPGLEFGALARNWWRLRRGKETRQHQAMTADAPPLIRAGFYLLPSSPVGVQFLFQRETELI